MTGRDKPRAETRQNAMEIRDNRFEDEKVTAKRDAFGTGDA